MDWLNNDRYLPKRNQGTSFLNLPQRWRSWGEEKRKEEEEGRNPNTVENNQEPPSNLVYAVETCLSFNCYTFACTALCISATVKIRFCVWEGRPVSKEPWNVLKFKIWWNVVAWILLKVDFCLPFSIVCGCLYQLWLLSVYRITTCNRTPACMSFSTQQAKHYNHFHRPICISLFFPFFSFFIS